MDHSGMNFSNFVQAMTQGDSSLNEQGALSAGGRIPRLPGGGEGRKSRHSEEIAEAVRKHLDSADMHYSFLKERGTFTYYMRFRFSFFQYVVVNIRILDDAFIVLAGSPIFAPHRDKKLMHEAAEMLCRMNFGLRGGAFDLDVDDGELSFRRFIDCTGIVPSEEMVGSALSDASSAFRVYGKAIAEVFLGVSSAEDAVRRAEKEFLGSGDDHDDDDDD